MPAHRKPTQLKIIAGTAQPCRMSPNEPKLPRLVPPPPGTSRKPPGSSGRTSCSHRVARVGGLDAVIPACDWDHAIRMYSGRPSSSMRFSTLAAMATSVAWRPPVCERSPSPMTRFHREMSDSTRARQLYPEALCQPMRPRSAIHRRCVSRCVGADCAASLGTALARGGTTTAASG
jgi:hypothetical protein